MLKSLPGDNLVSAAAEWSQRLRYGLNETVSWRSFASGSHREEIGTRLRELDTRVVRLMIFDKGAADPLGDWEPFAAFVQAVLNAGAVPMITFAKFGPPYDDPAAIRGFAGRCADVVAACVRQWGEVVRDWMWCVWHHPNSDWVSAGMTFDHYRCIYEEAVQAVLRHLGPLLGGRRPLLGGPAVDGFQPFWADWVWRFVNEIDNRLIGFASWHQFGDWREVGAWGAPADEKVFRALLMARVSEYETRARAVGRMLKGRGILNVCGELNVHAHHEPRVSRAYNQTAFGAAYYAAAIVRLMRGGADLELWKCGTDDAGPYGLMDGAGAPNLAFHAKRLVAAHVRPGDRVLFPEVRAGLGVDVVVARGERGRQSALVVHQSEARAAFPVAELFGDKAPYHATLKIDRETDGRIVDDRYGDVLCFAGYGVAVLTNAAGD